MKTKIVLLIFMMTCLAGFAQQDAQYTQYMYNTINVNPAYAGSRGVLSMFGLHRTQWVGLDGAPVTNTLSINAPIPNSQVGVGLSFVNDRIGPTEENQISADVSYTIPTSEEYKLSFGVKGTADLFSLNPDKLKQEFGTSDILLQNLHNDFSPNIGAGVYFHSSRNYIGLSVPNFFQTKRYDDNTRTLNQDLIHAYLIGGHVFDLSSDIKFKPAFLLKAVQGAPLQLDISGNFMFNEKFVLGAAWRWSAAVSLMAGFQVNPGLYIGYGYDHETTNLAHYNSGSHEIFLRYELFQREQKIISPRFF